MGADVIESLSRITDRQSNIKLYIYSELTHCETQDQIQCYESSNGECSQTIDKS
jgi:hypothetical protein